MAFPKSSVLVAVAAAALAGSSSPALAGPVDPGAGDPPRAYSIDVAAMRSDGLSDGNGAPARGGHADGSAFGGCKWVVIPAGTINPKTGQPMPGTAGWVC